MTLQECEKSEKVTLTPQEAASILGVNPMAIRVQAHEGTLPFPYFRSGRVIKILRKPFLEWLNKR